MASDAGARHSSGAPGGARAQRSRAQAETPPALPHALGRSAGLARRR